MKKIIFICACSVIVFSCRKDKPPVTETDDISVTQGGGVFIANEGNFTFGNATVSYFDFGTGNAAEDVYQPANGQLLGDVCQSLLLHDNKLYVVVNNSGKIEVCNRFSLVSEATITGLTSPRFILPVSNNKAYVTDLYSNAISVVDLNSNTKTGSIPCNGWTEEMVMLYGKVFVTNISSNNVYVIDAATDVLQDSIAVGFGGGSICVDQNDKIWVLCSGDQTNNHLGGLYKINALTKQVEASFIFPSLAESPKQIEINGAGNTLYYINNGIYKMDINAGALPANAIITQGTQSFYALGIDPVTNILYVSDAIDYIQQGKILRFTENGIPIDNFNAGIIPAYFCFNY